MEKFSKNKKISFYPVIIEPLEEGGFFASCPILQGCHAEGETYGEAIDNIRDVIKVHIELRQKKGEIISHIQIRKSADLNVQIPVPVGI